MNLLNLLFNYSITHLLKTIIYLQNTHIKNIVITLHPVDYQ